MSESDPTNLRLAASKSFADKLTPQQDQAAMVAWDQGVDFTHTLTSDLLNVKSAIDNVDSNGATDINVGLAEAIAQLDAIQQEEQQLLIAQLDASQQEEQQLLMIGAELNDTYSTISLGSEERTEAIGPAAFCVLKREVCAGLVLGVASVVIGLWPDDNETNCHDGIDNDEDGSLDYGDPDCRFVSLANGKILSADRY